MLVDNITSINGTCFFDNLALGSSVGIHVNFLNTAVKLGDEISIVANVVDAQENLLFHECTMKNKRTGLTVAFGTHTAFFSEIHKSYTFFDNVE